MPASIASIVTIEEEEKLNRTGKLIALEGDQDLVATQLRLLPPSQKILVLPSLIEPLDNPTDHGDFNARAFIQQIHKSYTTRLSQAHSFLQASDNRQPRLVLTNGGSVSARAACIARIAESTDGDITKAETTFNNIVKDGVGGLSRRDVDVSEKGDAQFGLEDSQHDAEKEDDSPSARAMKAAEALERETSDISSDELVDLSAEALHGDRIVVDNNAIEEDAARAAVIGDVAQRFKALKRNAVITEKKEMLFTAAKGEEIRRTIIVVPQRHSSLWHRRNTIHTEKPELGGRSSHRSSRALSRPISGYGSDDDDDGYLSSPGDETFPTTPGVEYGEACLVDMQSSESEHTSRRSRSVDRYFPSLFQDPQQSMIPQTLKHSVSHSQLRTRPPKPTLDQMEYFPMLPRTTFVKASQTTIRKTPSESEASTSSASSFRAATRVFVDRGTDAGFPAAFQAETLNGDIFQPVFPAIEDLVIHLHSEESGSLLKNIISSYKDGSYPQFPTRNSYNRAGESRKFSEDENRDMQPPSDKRKTYDPYAYTESRTHSAVKQNRVDSAIHMDPPTPFLPAVSDTIAEKFVDFSFRSTDTAVDLQNSLRHILSVHVPSSEGYTQQIFPTLPDLERLHKPVFRVDDSGSTGESGRTVDQIIALGCEAGVKTDFFSQISGYVEKLGTKKSGFSRSGRVDIRYFISNVLQNLAKPTDPLSDPEFLASCLVPQLEAYLASNTSTRLLVLYYNTEHLATVLALRRLVGTDVLRVAGVLDTLSSDLPPLTRPQTPLSPRVNPLSNEATQSRPSSRRQQSLQEQLTSSLSTGPTSPKKKQTNATPPFPVSFSRADYLIPSTATDSEIATFLSNIWKCLMQRSAFYTPEPEPKPVVIHAPPMPATPLPTFHENKKQMLSDTSKPSSTRQNDRSSTKEETEKSYPPSSFKPPRSITSDKASRIAGTSVSTPNLNRKYAASVTSSVRSVRTTASEKVRREDREWENFYIAEEDSDDDEYDKMILGRGFATIVPEARRKEFGKVTEAGKEGEGEGADIIPGMVMVNGQKRGTKKALKWLGLA